MEEEYKNEKSQSDSPAEPKIYDPFFEEEDSHTEKPSQPIYEEGTRITEEKSSNVYKSKDTSNTNKKESESRSDARQNSNNDAYPRENQKNSSYGQIPFSTSNPYKATYPELHQRMEKESEILIHFYIKNISSYYQKNEVYKKLYDTLQHYGPIKEISLQRVSHDAYDLAIGMKYDEGARYIIESDELQPFINSMETNDSKPYLEPSFIFNYYLRNSSLENNHYDSKRDGKVSASSHDSHRRSGGYEEERRHDRDYSDRSYDNRSRDKESTNKDRDYDRRNQYRSPGPASHSYGKKDGAEISRSRSRSKSPSGRHDADDRKRDYDSNKPYQVKDFINKRKVEVIEIPDIDSIIPGPEKAELKVNVEVNSTASQVFQYSSGRTGQGQVANEKPLVPGQRPEKPPGPPAGQPVSQPLNQSRGSDQIPKESYGKSNNPTAPPLYMSPNFPDPSGGKGQPVGSTSSKEPGKGVQGSQPGVAQAGSMSEQITSYDNYCLFLGIPTEITEMQIMAALKAQDIELPIKWEWIEEGVTGYLRLCFKSDKTVKELILKEITVGPTLEDLIYPVLVLPWLPDKKLEDLLVYHQVQVESSIPLDSLFLHLFYSPYGPLADIIDMKPSKHVLIFTKQPHAQHVMSIPQISLQKNNIEVVMKHSVVDSCYPLVRKNLQAHQQTTMTQYIKSIQPVSLPNTAAEIATQQEQRQLPLYQSPPHYSHNQEYPSGKSYESKASAGRYLGMAGKDALAYPQGMKYDEEGYYMERERESRPQYPQQNYRMDKYRYNGPERNDFFEGNRRRDNPRNQQPSNQRYNQSPREDQGGYGGPGSGNRPYNNHYQYGRNPEPRKHHYHQNISPESRQPYHQGRNSDMRPQERGLEYRGPQGKGHEQRQQPPYPK